MYNLPKNKMNKNKGFTIIELIVVIAIIAVLAAIVLVNVTQYIAKSKDSAIRANLASAMTASAIYYEGASSGAVVCADTASGFATAYGAAATISGAESCADSAGAFCACAQLMSDTTKYYCVDSVGHKAETSITCAIDCADGSDYVCDGL